MPSNTHRSIVYLTAGAGGMYCGSCLHDNALAKALLADGWDVQLVPTYTPIRTDEADVSVDHVLFGGLNVYLQQKIPLFRYLPKWVDSVLDRPGLIRRVTSRAMNTDAATLGSLAHSMLLGLQGNQRKEVNRMVDWLASQSPDLVVFSNILIGGGIEAVKDKLSVPVVVMLQGDDVFLDGLQEPWRTKCVSRIKAIVGHVDAFVVHSEFYRDSMAQRFGIPLEKIHATPLGIDTQDFLATTFDFGATESGRVEDDANETVCVGYLARLAPEKGLDNLVEALLHLSPKDQARVRLKVAGWLGPESNDFAAAAWSRLEAAGWSGRYEYCGVVNREQKLAFFSDVDLFCVPTRYQEPKGLYVLEAMAAGVPVVASAHGVFPELIAASGGGILASPNDARDLAQALLQLIDDPAERKQLAAAGRQFVLENRNAQAMASATGDVFRMVMKQFSA